MNKNCLSAIIALMLSLNAAQSAHLYPTDKIDFDSFGADPTGIVDSHIALQNYINAKIAALPADHLTRAMGYDAVLPPGRFVNSSPLNLAGSSNNYAGPFSLRGAPGGATIIEGAINGGYLVRRVVVSTTQGPSAIRDIHFINYSGGCVSIGGLVGLNVSGCNFNSHGVMLNLAQAGTTAPENTFDVTVTGNIFFGGPPGGAATSDQADAIGILSHGQTDISGNTFTALAEGVRLSGTRFSVTGNRFEVNKIGMNLGIRENGGTWIMDRSFFGALSFEANDTAIWMQDVIGSTFTGITILGSAKSPSNGSQYGIRMNASAGGNLVIVSASYVVGPHSVASISALDRRAMWISVNTQNPTAGKDWVFPTGDVFYDHYINCGGLTLGTDQGYRSRVSQTVSVTNTTYTMRDDNKGKVVIFKSALPVAVSLPQPNQFNVAEQYYKFDQTWNARIKNLRTGVVTVTPVNSTIDGGGSIALSRYQSIEVRSDGAKYYVSGH